MTADRGQCCFAWHSLLTGPPSTDFIPHCNPSSTKTKHLSEQASWPLFCIFFSQNIFFENVAEYHLFSIAFELMTALSTAASFHHGRTCGSLSLNHNVGLSCTSPMPRIFQDFKSAPLRYYAGEVTVRKNRLCLYPS
jgi:hypothetical protein